MTTVLLTKGDFQMMCDAVRPGIFAVSATAHGHDIWLWRARACRDGHHNLASRFWHGRTPAFKDQTPLFQRWLAGGAKGGFFPDPLAEEGRQT